MLEVSQPRQPCWKLGRRWDRKDLPKLVVKNGRSGWYFRVVQEGELSEGELELVSRPNPEWSVFRASQVYFNAQSPDRAVLAGVPELASVWKLDLS